MIANLIWNIALGGWASAATSYAVREYRKRNAKPLICMGTYTIHQWSEWKDAEPASIETTYYDTYSYVPSSRTAKEAEVPCQERRCYVCNQLQRRTVPLASDTR